MILGCWFMLREIELARARWAHVYLQGNSVHVMLPVHKTDPGGSLI